MFSNIQMHMEHIYIYIYGEMVSFIIIIKKNTFYTYISQRQGRSKLFWIEYQILMAQI